MSDLNSSPALELVPASMVDEWSRLLPIPERSAFVGACLEAGADDERLQPILARYFSTWKTSLMGDDLSRLHLLATYEQIRDYVKVICLEDDYDVEDKLPLATIWPRYEDGQVAAEALGVELLKAMLAAQQLRPDRLQIRDKRNEYMSADPEISARLARNIFDGTDLAVTAFILQKESAIITIILAELSPEHQGQGKGFSMLRKADICLSHHQTSSYWQDQIRLAPALEELSLSFWCSFNKPSTGSFILDNRPWPALEKLELSMAALSTTSVMSILSNSEHTLTGISFRLMSLGNHSTWADLLSLIGNKFPHLAWFKLRNLSEGIGRPISFLALENDPVFSEPYKTGVKMLKKPNADGTKRIPMVEYEGPDANHVLRTVARCAVARRV